MRYTGCQSHGVRLPIISQGDNLPEIVADYVSKTVESLNIELTENDVIGVTEAIVAKSQGNYANILDVAKDIEEKFPDGTVGLVFPIYSRNRFLNILKGIAKGSKKVYVLFSYPSDEVGNPIMDYSKIDDVLDNISGLVSETEFRKVSGEFKHPFTNVDYADLYKSVGDNIEIYFSQDARDILKLTKNVLVAEIHSRNRTKERLLKAGANVVYTLSDVLSKSVNGSGFNENFGILGSNLSKDDTLKLFPRECEKFIEDLKTSMTKKFGFSPELLIYGDGAFKDPAIGIWELADPVVSPAFTEKLGGQPNEIKLKYVADNAFSHLDAEGKKEAITNLIKDKSNGNNFAEGTTPRKYADLLGSLCDLMSGSGDKGTPVILVRGYFDDYSME